ncbi:potassium channel family protein [Halobaculum sp. P14]|uniref:potassium channel family protein n=1 Tax=Halobaculum sp. P14 TaxID=3421638 RepID=UPI003EB72ACE
MATPSFPVQVLLGVYLGLLTGIVPALVAWGLGFLFKYFTSVSIPGFGVVVLALAIAGVNGGLLALNDPTVRDSATLLVGIIVVLMLSLYAHAKGDAMGASMPKRLSLRSLTERTLSADVVELAGARGEVRVSVAGDVADLEGYPPLPADLRAELREFTDTFPADLPLPELETAVEDRLRAEYDLDDVSVRLDERAKATVSAAPPVGNISRRVPSGKRAVSLPALLPTGMARGDEVGVVTDVGEFAGTVVAAKSDAAKKADAPASAPTTSADSGAGAAPAAPAPTSPTTTGGSGRVTVAVDRRDASTLLGADVERLTVRSRGTQREFELVSLLRRANKRFRRITARSGGRLDGKTLREAAVRDEYKVAVLAVQSDDRWQIAPSGDVGVAAGDDLIVVGTREELDRFGSEVAA